MTRDLITNGNHEVEYHSYLAVRPDFRIVELQISPKQEVPWHLHNNVQDTIYVLNGSVRVELNHPKQEVFLTAGQTFTVECERPHRVSASGNGSARFLVIQGIGEYDFTPLPAG